MNGGRALAEASLQNGSAPEGERVGLSGGRTSVVAFQPGGWRRRRLGMRAGSSAAGPGTYRPASSVRLPWLVGLLLFLGIGLATAAFVGRTTTQDVPAAVLDAQELVANASAQEVRKSLNEGVTDLDALVRLYGVAERRGSGLRPEEALASFDAAYKRFSGVALDRIGGGRLAAVGDAPNQLGLAAPQAPGLRAVRTPNGEAIVQFAPDRASQLVATARYDRRFLVHALEAAGPADAWLVDGDGFVIGELDEPFPGLTTLTSAPLRAAAQRALRGESGATVIGGGANRREIVSFAPVAGTGPAGSLGWAVVTERRVDSLSLPQIQVRREAVLLGIAVGLAALFVFGWLYLVLVAPLARLQAEAERVAFGDLRHPVEIRRYDEIGLIGRALDRLRVTAIRARDGGSGRR